MTSQFSWLGFFTDAGIPLREAEKYSLQFDDNRMKPDMLPDLTKDLLNDLGITLIGDILAILRHGRQVLKQLERGQLAGPARSSSAVSGRDEERTVQPLRKTASATTSTLPEFDAQKTKRAKKSSKSKSEAAAQVAAVATTTSSVRLGPLPPTSSVNDGSAARSANGMAMEEQPRRIITRPASAALPAYHSDAVVSNASQTTVIRQSALPQSAHSRLGNGAAVAGAAAAAAAPQRQVVHASAAPPATSESAHRHAGPAVSQTSSDRATRLVEAITTAAIPSASQAIKQTVSMRLPSTMPTVTTGTRHQYHYDDDAAAAVAAPGVGGGGGGDGGEGLRRIVHAVSSSSEPSYQRPVQMQTVSVSERGGQAVAIDSARPSTTVRLSGGGVKSVITRVVPPHAPHPSSRGVDAVAERTTGASRQPLSAASLSKLHGSYRDDYGDDANDPDAGEEDNRRVAVRLSRKSSSSSASPPAKRPPPGQAFNFSSRAARVAKPAVKSRLGPVVISPQTVDRAPALSSRSEPRLRQSKSSRSSVFNRLGEMS